VRHDNADPQRLLVERRCFEQGDTTGHATLRVRHEAVPADSFVTPPDYARMDMGGRALTGADRRRNSGAHCRFGGFRASCAPVRELPRCI